jgi:hypothetical protein
MKFHDGTQASESTHETLTISHHHECYVTTRCIKSHDNKKKKNLLITMYDDKYDVMMSMSEHFK